MEYPADVRAKIEWAAYQAADAACDAACREFQLAQYALGRSKAKAVREAFAAAAAIHADACAAIHAARDAWEAAEEAIDAAAIEAAAAAEAALQFELF